MLPFEAANRERLIKLLNNIKAQPAPAGWRLTATIAVGGLTEVGFSKKSDHLLVLSSGGRGVIACASGEKVARDYADDGDWLDLNNLCCMGIGPIEDEIIQLAGLHGGGLPLGTNIGESLELASPDWPKSDLIFCSNFKSPFVEGHQSHCTIIASDYFRTFGFSWSGNAFVYATGGDVHVFFREKPGL